MENVILEICRNVSVSFLAPSPRICSNWYLLPDDNDVTKRPLNLPLHSAAVENTREFISGCGH